MDTTMLDVYSSMILERPEDIPMDDLSNDEIIKMSYIMAINMPETLDTRQSDNISMFVLRIQDTFTVGIWWKIFNFFRPNLSAAWYMYTENIPDQKVFSRIIEGCTGVPYKACHKGKCLCNLLGREMINAEDHYRKILEFKLDEDFCDEYALIEFGEVKGVSRKDINKTHCDIKNDGARKTNFINRYIKSEVTTEVEVEVSPQAVHDLAHTCTTVDEFLAAI